MWFNLGLPEWTRDCADVRPERRPGWGAVSFALLVCILRSH